MALNSASSRPDKFTYTFHRLFNLRAVCLLLCLLPGSFSALADEAQRRELQWAYISNFLPFISWPQPQQDIVKVCLVGGNPFASAQDKMSGSRRKGRKSVIETYQDLPSLGVMKRCQVIYFSHSISTAQLSFVFSKLSNSPIVTIGEHQGFIKIGGLLQFTERENKLRFRLNKRQLSTMNLKIHPSLLRLSE